LLVSRLKASGEVVAVTGDGTNDAPALRLAHVGLSMGIEGTGVAKQASDIIILDDNFASIVKSVMWGRNVRENIQKFLQFQLTVNLVALMVAFVAAITDQVIRPRLLNPDSERKGGVALGHSFERDAAPMGKPHYGHYGCSCPWHRSSHQVRCYLTPPQLCPAHATPAPRKLLLKPPTGRNYPLISATMWRNIIGQGVYQLIVLFGILYFGQHLLESDDTILKNTFLFNSFIFCQVS